MRSLRKRDQVETHEHNGRCSLLLGILPVLEIDNERHTSAKLSFEVSVTGRCSLTINCHSNIELVNDFIESMPNFSSQQNYRIVKHSS